MLDEECVVPQGSDRSFVNKIKEKHKEHRRFGVLRTKPTWFSINHFAGAVHYCSDSFLEKNKDQLSQDAQDVISGAGNEFARLLFSNFLNRGGKGADTPPVTKQKKVTVSGEFKNQLTFLMDTVQETDPHFIR